MKLWETERFVLDLTLGKLVRSISTTYVPASNFEEAQKKLLQSGETLLRLTGNWFIEPVEGKLGDGYKEGLEESESTSLPFHSFKENPKEYLEDFTLDSLFDWLGTLSKEEAFDVWLASIEGELDKKSKVIEGYLMFKYGSKKN